MPRVPDPATTAPPKRIQMRRTKGWRKPEGVISCMRPGRYGNPYRVVRGGTPGHRVWWADGPGLHGPILCKTRYTEREAAEDAVAAFRLHAGPMGSHEIEQANIDCLRGHDLGCSCALDAPCHVDVLLEWANG